MKEIIYFDPSMGVSGDMFVGAMLDLGADFNKIQNDIKALGFNDVEISSIKTTKNGISATKFNIKYRSTGKNVDDSDHSHDEPHRNLDDIKKIVNSSKIDNKIKIDIIGIFQLLATAEAKVHNATIDTIHFHEVGAVDAIIDITAAASSMSQFNAECLCSPINTGVGSVVCHHGVLPVPAPATLALLCDMQAYSDGTIGELATPTGVAILKYYSRSYGNMPKMTLSKYGNGAGSKDFAKPNIFRVAIGKKLDL